MNTFSVDHSKKKKAINAVIRKERSSASGGLVVSYYASLILKLAAFIAAAAGIAYVALVSKDAIDIVFAILAFVVLYGVGMIAGTFYRAKLGGEYRCRMNEKLTVLDDRMIYSYHDVRLPQMNARWSYEIPFQKIEQAEISAKGYLITLKGLFQGDLFVGETSTNPDTWSRVDILNVFNCDINSLLQQHGVNKREI